MPSEVLLTNIQNIFIKIKDSNTRFIYPIPAQCYNAIFPLNVKIAYDNSNDSSLKKLVVSKIYSQNDLQSLGINLSQSDLNFYQKIQLGDEIISIKNLGIDSINQTEILAEQALNELTSVTYGANEDSAYSVAAMYFFMRTGNSFKLPKGIFTLKIKQEVDNKIVTYSFPWIYLNVHSTICNTENTSRYSLDSNLNSNSNNNLMFKIIEKNKKKIALIKIKSFMPKGTINAIFGYYDLNYEARENEIYLIRNFILKNKNNIEGVIIDIRDNFGGMGSYGQIIANLFTNKFVKNYESQALVSRLNKDIYLNMENLAYITRLNSKHPLDNGAFSTSLEINNLLNDKTKIRDINAQKLLLQPSERFNGYDIENITTQYAKESDILKPIFTTKPVAVLTNSNCFSACEVFVATLKDNKIARIFGETKHTAGSGAISVGWNNLAEPLLIHNEDNQKTIIPNAKPLPKGSNFIFSLSKIYRKSKNIKETYIEGIGVLSDYVYKPLIEDIKKNDSIIYNKIMNDILDKSNSKEFYLDR